MLVHVQSLSGAAVVLGALAVLVLLSRWVFSAGPRRPAGPGPTPPTDYGLLVPVAHTRTVAQAVALRDVLADHNIRATVGPDGGAVAVLVFPPDLTSARECVGTADV